MRPSHLLSSTNFRFSKVKNMIKDTRHRDAAPFSYKALITKLPAKISKKGYEYFSKIGNMHRLSLYHRYITEAYLEEVLAMCVSATNHSQGNYLKKKIKLPVVK